MKRPHSFVSLIWSSVLGYVVMAVLFAFFAYLYFGNKIKSIVMLNFSKEYTFFFVLEFMYGVAICITFPMIYFAF
jgi:hypothetical protein